MQYRPFGELDFEVSALGFGAMRLPVQDGNIRESEAIKMIRYGIEHGVNYIDTAYSYHNGQSEFLVGRALQNGYREKVKLATKFPSWLMKEPSDFDRYLDEQLERLQTDHIDFYLLHALNKTFWPKLKQNNVFKSAEKALADGRITYLGFSFHDKYPLFEEIIDAYDWTFCQIQYNYMDLENQAGTKGLQHAVSKGIAVVIMEPILGGRLVNPPQAIQELWETAEKKRTPADWALQWLWNQPEVSTVLSGMSTMEQVQENVASAEISHVHGLTETELTIVDRVREKYRDFSPIPCTKCEYCLPCPSEVNIPRNFEIYNNGLMYEKPETSRFEYNQFLPEPARASACIQCQECEEKCPQSIPISQWMPVVHEVLGEGKSYRKSL
jgi:hypothetical protein